MVYFLNRTIAEKIIQTPEEEINKAWEPISFPEEHYFITTVFLHNLESQIKTTPNLASGATTFTNWHDMREYPFVNDRYLKNYSDVSSEELIYLLSQPCLFGRKFNLNCTVDGNAHFPLFDFFKKSYLINLVKKNSYFFPIFFILGHNYSNMDDKTFEYKKISIMRLKKINELNNMIDVLRNHIEDLNEKLEKFISGEFANNETNLDESYRYQQIIQKLEKQCKNVEIDFYCSQYKVKGLCNKSSKNQPLK